MVIFASSANLLPHKKSLFPCMKNISKPLRVAVFICSVTSDAKDESSSSPTQDSNKSPKMYRCENSCAAVFKNLKKPSFVEGVFSDKWRSDMNPNFIHSL